MSYLKKKEKYIRSSREFKEGMEASERLVEEEIRSLISPYTELVKNLNILVDTKKANKKGEILKWLLENPDTLKKLNKNIEHLINLVRC
jgi:hypothetical protein